MLRTLARLSGASLSRADSEVFLRLRRLPWEPQALLGGRALRFFSPPRPSGVPDSGRAASAASAPTTLTSGSSSSSSSGGAGGGDASGGSGGGSGGGGGGGLWAFLVAKKAEFQALVQRYGWFTGFTYFGVYLVTLGGVYASVRVGLLPAPDVNDVVNGLSAKQFLLGPAPVHIPPQWRDFATAWIYTKTTEPLRMVATIVIVPVLAKQLPPHVLAALGVRASAAAAAAAAAAKQAK